ncbi:MAG: PadR family transcriptional regulator [Acidobacteriota bacterium]|nr:PadR family transcriptional regulator [Acidobacteriota bacterium]
MGKLKMQVTTQTLRVLGALVSSADEISGADIARSTELASGTLYPILARLEKSKWIQSRWEEGDPHELGRPRRRLYKITALGARKARQAVNAVTVSFGRSAWELS